MSVSLLMRRKALYSNVGSLNALANSNWLSLNNSKGKWRR